MPQWLGSAILTARAKRTLKLGSIGAATTLGVLGVAQVACAEPVYQNSYQNDTSISYFQAAAEAADRQDISALYNYEQMMNGGLFAMYPAYWRLSSDINSQSAASVAQFVRQYPDTVMAEKLAADFAEAKAASGDYAAVRQVANLITNPDSSERCAIALGFNYGGDTMRALSEKSNVWLTTLKQPELCNQLALAMSDNPLITNTDRKNRLKRMLREGKTGDIMALSGKLGTPIAYSALSEIQLSPMQFFNRFGMQPYSESNQSLYLYAIGRLANKSYREAAMQLDFDIKQDDQRAQHLLSDETRRYAYRILGVQRMNHNTDDGFNSEAVDWFRKSLGEPFNFEESEDYAQAAIRYSRWNDVIEAVASMDPDIQKEDIWQYWLARAYEGGSDASKRGLAKQIYQRLAKNNTYYGLLAKDKVGQRFDARSLGGSALPQISSYDSNRVLSNPHFARAFALYNADSNRSYANREWNWAVKKARDSRDDALIIAAARRAYDIGWLDRAIYAIDNTDSVNSLALSHPMPHQSSVVQYSRAAGIDPAWAYGIMRQESRFVTSARSNVGASGLMQIMPDTAKYIARKLGESYSASGANSGDTNIRYGTWYMGDILAKLNYQPVLATAGYNAGPNKAKRWQPDFGQLAADQYVESIAYPETRGYVKHVMENATIYGSLLGQPKSITERMGTIPAAF
ncbi:MAG: transglycosylase SLT domain-containing protein [Psychrobacter sp.]|nr:transglycosylase SLT domain-containing protein [Psychrobacter sp.]